MCRASIICSSSPVPRVVTTRPCVSPLVNKAEPWVLGRNPVSESMGLTVELSRPSILFPPLIIAPRTISLSSFLIAVLSNGSN